MTTRSNYQPPKFKHAFSNSGYIAPIDINHAEHITQLFLSHANVSTIDEARALSLDEMSAANMNSVLAHNASFTYGPTVDGDLIPEWTALSIRDGLVVGDIDILMGHTADEGGTFAAPWVKTRDQFKTYIRSLIMYVKQDMIDVLVDDLYAGELPAATMPFFGDLDVSCYMDWVAKAFGGQVWQYEFAVANKSFHVSDMPYLYWDTENPAQPKPIIADELQNYLTNFIKTGRPGGEGLPPFPDERLPPFPQRGDDNSHVVFTEDGVSIRHYDAVSRNCDFLQQPLFE